MVIVSLEKAKDRRERIKAQLEKLNIDAIIMDAVDGQKLSAEELNKPIKYPGGGPGSWRYGEILTPGEVGCLRSHIKVMEMAKENSWPYVVVIEDDVIFADDFEKRMKLLFKIIPNDWEHIYICGIPLHQNPYYVPPQFPTVVPSIRTLTTAGMVIRDTTYDKMIEHWNMFELPADDRVLDMITRTQVLKSYTYYPFPLYVDDSFTYIWDHSLEREHGSVKFFKNNLL